MQRQNCCYNHFLVLARWTQDISKGTSSLRRKRKTLKGLSSLIFFLLTCLVGSLLIKAKPTKKTKTTNKVSSAVKDRNRVVAPLIFLPWVLILFLRKKRGILPKLSAIPAIRKNITLTNILKIQKKSQKTSDRFGNLYVGDFS